MASHAVGHDILQEKEKYWLILLAKVKKTKKKKKWALAFIIRLRASGRHFLLLSVCYLTCLNSPRSGTAAHSAVKMKEAWLGVIANPSLGTFPSFCRWCFPKNEPPTSEFLKGLLKRQIPGLYPRPMYPEPQRDRPWETPLKKTKSCSGNSYHSWSWRITVLEGGRPGCLVLPSRNSALCFTLVVTDL